MSENIKDMVNEFLQLRDKVMETEDGGELLRFGELRKKLFDELGVMTDVQVMVVTMPLATYEENATVQDALNTMVETILSVEPRVNIEEFEDIAFVELSDIMEGETTEDD